MLSSKMEAALNEQLNKELHSAYIYLAMAAYFQSGPFEGMANWMDVQAKEEMTHAMKFYNYILGSGGKVQLFQIETPTQDWKNPLEVFEQTLAHERFITKSILELASLAQKEKDRATSIFLEWFITEQAEEEDSANKVIEKIKLFKDAPYALYMVDRELAARTFVAPATTT